MFNSPYVTSSIIFLQQARQDTFHKVIAHPNFSTLHGRCVNDLAISGPCPYTSGVKNQHLLRQKRLLWTNNGLHYKLMLVFRLFSWSKYCYICEVSAVVPLLSPKFLRKRFCFTKPISEVICVFSHFWRRLSFCFSLLYIF